VLLGTLLVLATALLAGALFDARTACLAAAIAAVYPTFVAYSHYLWAETLFALLLTVALALVVASASRGRHALAAAAGLFFGAAALTRELAFPVAAAAAVWLVATAPPAARRPALYRALAVLGLAALVVLPWTLRNAALFGRPVPVSTVGWMALREGNTLPRGDWLGEDEMRLTTFRLRWFREPDEMARVDSARRETLALVRSEQPAWIAKKLVRTIALLFTPDSYLLLKTSLGAYGEVPLGAVRGLLLAGSGAYAVVLVAAVLGMAGAAGRGRRLLPCLVVAAVTAVHVVANAKSRYRLPLMPLLVVYASYALLHARALSGRLRGGPLVAAALAVALFLAVCVPHFAPQAAALWWRGSYR
jgi:4-amino-4-deoxy-L-arabinose transferase-like glycosyltransferase